MRNACFALLLVPCVALAQDPVPNDTYDVVDLAGYGEDGPTTGAVTGADGLGKFVGHFTSVVGTIGFIYDHPTRSLTTLGAKRPKRIKAGSAWVGTDYSQAGAAVAITGIGTITQELVLPSGATQSWAEDTDGAGKVVGSALVGGVLKPVLWTNGVPEYLPLPAGFTIGEAFRFSNSGRILGEATYSPCIDLVVWSYSNGAWSTAVSSCPFGGYTQFRFTDVGTDDLTLAQLSGGNQDPALGLWRPSFQFSFVTQEVPSLQNALGQSGALLNNATPTGLTWALLKRTNSANSGLNGKWAINSIRRSDGWLPQSITPSEVSIDNHPYWEQQSNVASVSAINGAYMQIGSQQNSVFYGQASFVKGNVAKLRPAIWVPDDGKSWISGLVDFGPWVPPLDHNLVLSYRWKREEVEQVEDVGRALLYKDGNVHRYAVPVPSGFASVSLELSLACMRAPGQYVTWLANTRPGLNSPSSLSNFTGETYRLKGGDITADGIVDIADYTKLAASFDKNSSDADWFVPLNGVSPAMCDLDGNDIVDIGDYSVLASNFDQIEVKL